MFSSSDVEGPVISGCPSNQSGFTENGVATGTISWTAPTATDNSGTQTLTSDYNPGDSFLIGTTTVTYTSTDGAGNTAICSFDVIVNGEPLLARNSFLYLSVLLSVVIDLVCHKMSFLLY